MQEGTGDARFPKHFDGKRFYNPDAPQVHGLLELLRWKLTSRPERSPGFISDVEQSIPPRRVEGSGLRTTLVNHSTVLLQQRGCNILTDPIWSERASPLSSIGPRRRRKPGVSWEDLPPIDTVLISHNHYDHLDLPTLRRLASRGDSTFIVPSGGARLLRRENIGPAHEMDWGDSLSLRSLTIHCVPALHFSSRGIYDRNQTLWCGYVIECRERLVYFAGDTGFGRHFARFGKSSDRRASRYCRSERTNHAGSCRRFIWVQTRRLGHMTSWPPGPASRSTMELSNWRMRASTLRGNSSSPAHGTTRFWSSRTANSPTFNDHRQPHARAGQHRGQLP